MSLGSNGIKKEHLKSCGRVRFDLWIRVVCNWHLFTMNE